jgi:hypothetical protein
VSAQPRHRGCFASVRKADAQRASCIGFALARVVCRQSGAQYAQDAKGGRQFVRGQTPRQFVGSRVPGSDRVVVGTLTRRRQHDQLRPLVVRIVLELDQAFPRKLVDDALDVLPVRPEVAGKPCHRLRSVGVGDGPHDLPAGARQAEGSNQPVAPDEGGVVHAEEREDEIRQRFSRGRSTRHAGTLLTP